MTAKELLRTLKETGHVQVVAPHSAGYLMFVPAMISSRDLLILQLLNVTCGRESVAPDNAGGFSF